ncbi:MAG TPA: SRPBCC family protein [Acidimicrobiales bacterium]|jgi:hypothetical protein|nr:SRPBCC family protein [Acidimicrobiales bacterium]
MATMRQDVWIDRPADDVWSLVRDSSRVTEWFPHMTDVKVDDDAGTRTITLESGLPLLEDIVSVRDDLRRFQYRLVGPLPVQHHLASIDVIADPADIDHRCLVTYSTDVEPHALAFILDGAVREALDNLKRVMEG